MIGRDALTTTDDGVDVVPETAADWSSWVSPTATRNFTMGDPLLDWLELYGADHGFKSDRDRPGYDPRTDFTEFIFRQGLRFEEAVVRHLSSLVEVVRIQEDAADQPVHVRSLDLAMRTHDAMRQGAPMIYQGVLRNPSARIYGAPDLLVRSDVLRRFFPGALTPGEAAASALGLGETPWHYRVVDIKFTTLRLNAAGFLGNDGSAPAYKVQTYLYNQALGRVQGILPSTTYILGRSWAQTRSKQTVRGTSCLEVLGAVRHDGELTRGELLAARASAAVDWVRRVRTEGRGWSVLPAPSVPYLYPDMTNQEDSPYHAAKKAIAEEMGDVTLLWQVGRKGREAAHQAGIRSWRDPACTPAVLGVNGSYGPTLEKMLDLNRAQSGPVVHPARVSAAENEWRAQPRLEFYVDFETVSDLNDDFSSLPQKGGQALIFMVGCGHMEDGEWRFSCFTADQLAENAEQQVIDGWFDHMAAVKRRLDPDGPAPRVIHWSNAEVSTLETAYNSARERRGDARWPSLQWFDFLSRVIKAEPVVVRGAFGFGLKSVAKALHRHGLIQTNWADGPTDGLGAMVGAWWCAEEARKRGVSLRDIDLMDQIRSYNEVDCRAMMEAVLFLRRNH